MRLSKFALGAMVLGAAIFVGSANPAQAVFAISFTTSSGTTTIVDGGPGDTNHMGNPPGNTDANGKIGFSGTIDGFEISVFLSTSNSPGTNRLAQVAIGSLDLNNTNATSETITIRAADQGFHTGTEGFPMELVSLLVGMVTQDVGATSRIEFQSYADDGNNPLSTFPFATAFSTPEIDTGNIVGVDGSSQGFNLAARKFGFVDANEPYSLASRLEITLSANASLNAVSGKTEIVVPVPAGVVMALTGLPVLGLGLLRRRRAAKAPVA